MLAIQNAGFIDKNMYDVFHLTKHGHRKYNHDMASALMSAYMVNPDHAAELAITHLMADKMSNYMIDQLGTENKEIAEGVINKLYKLQRESLTGRKSKTKRMFY